MIDGCSKITGQLHKLICREEVQLIRPKKLADTWSKKQYQQGHIDLTLKEAGIKHAKAHIISITSFIPKLTGKGAITQQVTGIFKRHALNTVYYTFKDISTGEISGIHATPSHGFYLKNRRAFLPVGDITEKDTLITSSGNHVKLVNHRAGTGETCDNITNIPVWTYNLEVLEKHVYFAGSDRILVHNTCLCGACKEEFSSPCKVRTHCHVEKHEVLYCCGIGGCIEEEIDIARMHVHQWDYHKVYNQGFCLFCGVPLKETKVPVYNCMPDCQSVRGKIHRRWLLEKFKQLKSRAQENNEKAAIKEYSEEVQQSSELSSYPTFSSSAYKQFRERLAQFSSELPDELIQYMPSNWY